MISTEAQNTQPGTQTTSITTLSSTVSGLPWDIYLSKHPHHEKETVTFTSEQVGILKHFVEVRPVYTNGECCGYRVSRYHDGQEQPTVLEECAPSRDEALDTAHDCMKQMTN
ncbi:hypothetical protein [Haloarcula sp. H-GB5]